MQFQRITAAKLRGVGFAAALCAGMLFTHVAMAQEFIAYEGKNAVHEGDGGAKKTVEGVDFWSDGAPPRKFKLLGYITDRRQKTGLIGMVSMSHLENDIAELAKKNGGDAVIVMASEAETVGTVGMANGTARTFGHTTNASGFGFAAGVQKQNSKFAVLKYVAEPEAPASTGEQPAAVAAPSAQPAEAKPQ